MVRSMEKTYKVNKSKTLRQTTQQNKCKNWYKKRLKLIKKTTKNKFSSFICDYNSMNNYFKNTVTIKTERWKSKLANSFSFFALWLTFLWFHPFPLIGFSFRSFFCVSCHRKYLYTRLCQKKKYRKLNLQALRYNPTNAYSISTCF